MLVQKKARQIHAWCLGEGSEMEERMIAQGKISLEADGSYRVRSQENDIQGQVVQPGDYFKVDSTGAPYPNDREYFLANHTPIDGEVYLQTSPVLKAWRLNEPMCPEVEFILNSGKLRINEDDPARYFTAFMWDVCLHGAKDGVIIFDQVERTEGKITGAAFHFITREEFDLTYRIVQV